MKKINYLLSGLGGLFLIGFLFLAVVFFHTSIQKISSRNVKAEIQKFKAEETEFLKFKQTYREWQQADSSYARFIQNFLFQFEEFSAFRNNFESLLAENSLKPVGMNYTIENINREIAKVVIKFQAAGSYVSLKRFIFGVEQLSGIVFFRSLEMDRHQDGVQGVFNLEVYFAR
jgi:Tfp pilus assembly protein PilO